MISVVDLVISTHEPDARMIAVTLGGITVIPLTVKFYEQPIVDITVISRIAVYSHILDSRAIQEHLAASIVNITVTVMLRKSSVSGILKIAFSAEQTEPQCIVNPVEDRSCSLNFTSPVKV